jgi:hypothetical protein
MRLFVAALALLLAGPVQPSLEPAAAARRPCGPLPRPSGKVVRVAPEHADRLPSIVADAASGTTVLLEDGVYAMPGGDEASRRLIFRTSGVTLRSASNNADAVVLDGDYITNEIIAVYASDVTIAHVTIREAVHHPVHVTPPEDGGNVKNVRLYGVRFIDAGSQFLKVNPAGSPLSYVDKGRVECSLFRMTDDGRPNVQREPGGCYTGGIDAHGARGWVVKNNRFEGIYCAGEGLAEHAVHFWRGSRGTRVENNVILECARGIGFGLGENDGGRTYPDKPANVYIGHYGGMIRNNVIYATHPYFDTGIELSQASGARVYHNTIPHSDGATGLFSSIDYRFPNTTVAIRNNLVERITARDGGTARVDHNLEEAPLSLFADPGAYDFHLAPGADVAIDKGVRLKKAGRDMDGSRHDKGKPDLGADEYGR